MLRYFKSCATILGSPEPKTLAAKVTVAPACPLKMEITFDQPILLKLDSRSILHDFHEEQEGEVLVYQLLEVVAEKLRALLQTLARVEGRGWGTGRVSMDYYDLGYLLKNQDFSGAEIVDLS